MLVCVQVDAHLSYDTNATYDKVRPSSSSSSSTNTRMRAGRRATQPPKYGSSRWSGAVVRLGAHLIPPLLPNTLSPCAHQAMRLVDLYACRGIGPERLYIKLASTWEGVEACRRLQRQGIDCNMTLLFSFGQVGAGAAVGGGTE